jgi:hypothetical protein
MYPARSRCHARPHPVSKRARFVAMRIFPQRCVPCRSISLRVATGILGMTPVAAETRESIASRDPNALLASSAIPPDYPDQYHVTNGCYISTHGYIAKFKTAFPEERAEPITILPRRGGIRKPHTVALISWRGRWWLRDEYFGITSVRLPVTPAITPERIADRVAGICGQDSMTRVEKNSGSSTIAPEFSLEQRLSDVLGAAAVIRGEAEVYLVHSGATRIPMLYFPLRPGVVAVYDPHYGTALATSNTTDGLKVVPLVAQTLGYLVTSIERIESGQTQHLARAD